jgi:hypothetical protein
VHYAYGLGLGEDRGLKTISHGGGWAGYRTIISNYPDEKVSIIILSNAGDFDPDGNSSKIASLFLKDKFKSQQNGEEKIKNLPTIKVDTLLMKKYTGTYLLAPDGCDISRQTGPKMQANGEDKFPTAAKSDSVFWIDAYGASITFVKDSAGQVNLLRYRSLQAKRIIPFSPNPSQFGQYAGSYYSEELETVYKVELAKGKLIIHHMRLGDVELTPDPSDEDQFTSKVGIIHFTKDDHQKITGLTLSGGRVKNIRFDKKS